MGDDSSFFSVVSNTGQLPGSSHENEVQSKALTVAAPMRVRFYEFLSAAFSLETSVPDALLSLKNSLASHRRKDKNFNQCLINMIKQVEAEPSIALGIVIEKNLIPLFSFELALLDLLTSPVDTKESTGRLAPVFNILASQVLTQHQDEMASRALANGSPIKVFK